VHRVFEKVDLAVACEARFVILRVSDRTEQSDQQARRYCRPDVDGESHKAFRILNLITAPAHRPYAYGSLGRGFYGGFYVFLRVSAALRDHYLIHVPCVEDLLALP
jgi:hypothetical protein